MDPDNENSRIDWMKVVLKEPIWKGLESLDMFVQEGLTLATKAGTSPVEVGEGGH